MHPRYDVNGAIYNSAVDYDAEHRIAKLADQVLVDAAKLPCDHHYTLHARRFEAICVLCGEAFPEGLATGTHWNSKDGPRPTISRERWDEWYYGPPSTR